MRGFYIHALNGEYDFCKEKFASMIRNDQAPECSLVGKMLMAMKNGMVKNFWMVFYG